MAASMILTFSLLNLLGGVVDLTLFELLERKMDLAIIAVVVDFVDECIVVELGNW